jgi:hypothetical protein
MKTFGHHRLPKTSYNSNSHKSSPKRKSLIGFFESQQSWARASEGPRIRAGEEAGAGDIAPTKTGIGREARAKTNREKFDRLNTNFLEIFGHLVILLCFVGLIPQEMKTSRAVNMKRQMPLSMTG